MIRTLIDTARLNPACTMENTVLQTKADLTEPSGRIAVVVLGMHRSGTSAITRVLSLLGCSLPKDLLPARDDNPTGFWESAPICAFNDELLASAGSSWDDWEALNRDWIDSPVIPSLKQRAIEILASQFDQAPLFVIKDPRFSRLMPFWQDVLRASGADIRCLIVLRSPWEVAASLRVRNNFSSYKTQLLWLRHVLDAEHHSRGFPRAILTYDQLLGQWRPTVAGIARSLGLSWPRTASAAEAEIDAFLRPRHRHHSVDRSLDAVFGELDRWIADTGAVLDSLPQAGDDALLRLDQIREEFNKATGAIGVLLRENERNHMHDIASLQAAADAEKGDLQDEMRDLRQAYDALRQEYEASKTQLAATCARSTALDQALEILRCDRDGARKQCNLLTGQLDQARIDRDALVEKLERSSVKVGALMAERAHLSPQNADLYKQVELLSRRFSSADALRQEALTRISALESSTSWRLTRPLRAVVGLVKGNPAYLRQWNNLLGRSAPERPSSDDTRSSMEPGKGTALKGEAVAADRAHLIARSEFDLSLDVDPRAPVLRDMEPKIRSLEESDCEAAAWATIKSYSDEGSLEALLSREREQFRVVYVSGEPHTPGHQYRVVRMANACRAVGVEVTVVNLEDAPLCMAEISKANVVVIWRVAWCPSISDVIAQARGNGAILVFDVDDLMIDPNLASVEVIDGIRSQGFDEPGVRQMFGSVRQTLSHCDYCTVTTEELAYHARSTGTPTFVIPNGYDEAMFSASRVAARRKRTESTDGYIRIGYAGGSRTHQKDFGQCSQAIASLLRSRPHVRLVLFRVEETGQPLVDLYEFPELSDVSDQVEWRPLVPLSRLPEEIARFDVNLAPLEVGNPFCEAKSELKFFEAALAGVCTVASPTAPFRRVIDPGVTGFLAATGDEWQSVLTRLVDDAPYRRKVAEAAINACLWPFGPDRRTEKLSSLLNYMRGGRARTRAFAFEITESGHTPVVVPTYESVFTHDRVRPSEATVIIPLHNYAHYVVDALESVAAQSLQDLDLIIVDDCSTDDGLSIVCAWAEAHSERFNRVAVLKNARNSGLGPTRNVGFEVAETRYVMPLDADNRLRPHCLAESLRVIRRSNAAYAYPVIQHFGNSSTVVGDSPYQPARFVSGNYIDAMALISKAAWLHVGGYENVRHGWEDFDFWCRIIERGLFAVSVGGVPLAEYRVHDHSMLRTRTDKPENKLDLIRDMHQRHGWLSLLGPEV